MPDTPTNDFERGVCATLYALATWDRGLYAADILAAELGYGSAKELAEMVQDDVFLAWIADKEAIHKEDE